MSVPAARDYGEVAFTPVYGLSVPHDRREKGYLTSDPFLLAGLELGGIDPTFRAFTDTVHAVQRKRFEATGVLTAVSEDSLDRPPWFAYDSVLLDGEPWQCRSVDGRDASELRTLSAKAAFGWAALYPDDYGERLRQAVAPLAQPRSGFHAGRYERDGAPNESLNINTNAVILEAILYLERGGRPFLAPAAIPEPAQRGIQR